MGPALDTYVENALAQKRADADWTQAALAIERTSPSLSSQQSPGLSPGAGLDFRTRAIQAPISQGAGLSRFPGGLESISDLAARAMLAATPISDSVENFLKHRFSPATRRLIIIHGQEQQRRSILFLDPLMSERESPIVVPATVYAPLLETLSFGPVDLGNGVLADPNVLRDAILQTLWIARPRILVAGAAQMINTAAPRPPFVIGAVGQGSTQQTSTAGIIARDASGVRGVTTCFHGTGAVGTNISVNNTPTKITLASVALDTCFAPIPDTMKATAPAGLGGVLTSRAPGGSEKHTFVGAASGELVTRIVGYDFEVPAAYPGRQLCVHTAPDTNHGDSGAALINDADEIVGFAFQRTPYGADVPYQSSSWIWARSALLELDLTPSL